MLRIRKAQMEAFEAIRRAAFENFVLEHCRRNGIGTRHRADGEALLETVRRVIGQAVRYGLRREGQIIRFIDVSQQIGVWAGNGTLAWWAVEILSDAEIAPDLKIVLLEHRVRGMRAEEGAA